MKKKSPSQALYHHQEMRVKRINKNKEEQILHLPNYCPHCTLGMRPDKNNSQHCIGGAQLFPWLCNAMSSIHGCVAEGKGRAWNRPPVLFVRWCTLITDTLVQFMHTVEALIRTLKANHKAWNAGVHRDESGPPGGGWYRIYVDIVTVIN